MSLAQKIYKVLQSYFTIEGRKLSQLKKAPRFIEGTVSLGGKVWHYCDAPSFAWQYDEIMQRGIYDFNGMSTSARIIDCGANIGTSVLFFAKKFPTARITAFEPDGKVFACLQKNVETNKLLNIDLQKAAVYNKNGKLSFSAQGADGGRLSNIGTTIVNCVRLKDYLQEPIDFLKIDIEGAETEVIVDCAEQLRNVKNCFIEYHGFENETDSLHVILACLHDAGLRYCLESVTVHHQKPFVKRVDFEGFKNLINIYAWRL